MPTPQLQRGDQELLRLADQCVKCGYCLPHCPTYLKTRHEADSPRGRIALIQGLVTNALELTPTLTRHLDGCLTCRACETVCPSLVAYGRLADGAKARRVSMRPTWRRMPSRLTLEALSSARIQGLFARLASLYSGSRLSRLGGMVRHPKLRAYLRLAPAMAHNARKVETRTPEQPGIDLFVGCAGSSTQGQALEAAVRVFERLGVAARIPTTPNCCGAIMRHNGFPDAADRHRADCARAHEGHTLVGIASACIAELREQPGLEQTEEICAFLVRQHWPADLELTPLEQRVLVHEPCSHRNLLGGCQAVYTLLERIPGLDVSPLPGNDLCCGAAGTYLLQQPEMAGALLEDKVQALRDTRPDILVTTNPGCALHVLAGVQEAGLEIEVLHPIELIARQLPKRSADF